MPAVPNKMLQYLTFMRQAMALLATQRRRFTLLLVLSILAAFTEGLGASMLIPVIESLGDGGAFRSIPFLGQVSGLFEGMAASEKLRAAALAILMIVLLRGALLYLVSYNAVALPRVVTKELADRTYSAMLSASYTFVSLQNSGTVQNAIISLPRLVGNILTNFSNVLVNSAVVLVYLVLMIAISWEMTLASLAFLGFSSELLKRTAHGKVRSMGAAVSVRMAAMHQTVYESLNGLRLVHLLAAKDRMKGRWLDHSDAALALNLRRDKILLAISPILSTAAGILICLLILVSSFAEESENLAGVVILFMFLLFRLLGPVTTLVNARAAIQSDMHAIEESQEFLKSVEASLQSDGNTPFAGLKQDIVAENLTFRYPGRDVASLHDVSLRIPKGGMIALVGPSGAGKTTLVSMITRLFDPTDGRITVDGIDLRDLKLSTWRRKLGVVSQETIIFNDTVHNNIVFGREDIDPAQVDSAIRLAAADEFISALPQGLETIVGERGTHLSGGQQQRIALARAILAQPDILILDEATSNLDSITEAAVHHAIEELRERCTVIVIAHRLSTIVKADQILVMEDGRLVEQGRHAELMTQRGRYFDLISHQKLDIIDDTV